MRKLKISGVSESSPNAQAYLEGWRAGEGGKPKKYPPRVNTPELRAHFDEGYEDGTKQRVCKRKESTGYQ